MPIRPVSKTGAPALEIRDKLIQLLDDNRMTDDKLKQLNISNIVKNSPSDVRNPVLYISFLGMVRSNPTELGRQNITYDDEYVYNLLYIHSRFDRDVSDELIMAIDILADFFERHSSLDGLTTRGVMLDEGSLTNYIDEKNFYHAITMNLNVPVLKRRNRNQ